MILSIEHKKIEPDVLVLEFNGRITMGSDSQKIERGGWRGCSKRTTRQA